MFGILLEMCFIVAVIHRPRRYNSRPSVASSFWFVPSLYLKCDVSALCGTKTETCHVLDIKKVLSETSGR